MRSPKISFCMIVRDGAVTLPACLESVARLADELIVVDTGSTDDSPQIARSFGATVLSMPWRDDFAAARNEYLKVAGGAWILSLDADEVLGEVDRAALERLAVRADVAFVFTVHNYFAIGRDRGSVAAAEFRGEIMPGIGHSVSRTVRFFPRLPGIEYSYPVHESLLPSLKRHGIALRRCPVRIHHFGYLYGRDRMDAKAAAYKELGKKKLARHPGYFLAHLELGKLLLRDGDLDEAERLFEQCLRLNPRCSRAHYYLAVADLERQRILDALAHLQKGLAQSPRHSDMLHLRCRLEREGLEPGPAPEARSAESPAGDGAQEASGRRRGGGALDLARLRQRTQ